MRKKLLSIILSLAMVLAMIPAMGSVAYAEETGLNLHWEGNVAKWDAVDNASYYWIFVTRDAGMSDNYNHYAYSNEYDITELIRNNGSGTYKFTITPYVNGSWQEESAYSPGQYFEAPDLTISTPTNIRWEGNVAKWDASENAIKYFIKLYKNSTLVEEISTVTNKIEYDLTDKMEKNGTGTYTFSVAANGNGKTSEYSVESSSLNYTLIPIPTNIRWEGNVAKWDNVEGAECYWIFVTRDGGMKDDYNHIAYSNEYDITELINKNGCGSYTFSVSAYVSGAYGNTSVYSDALKIEHELITETIPAEFGTDGSKISKCIKCGEVVSTQAIPKISSVKLSTTSYTYNGSVKSPSLTVKDADGNMLVKGTDYTYSTPSGRKNVGTYTYKVTFKGKYTGSKSVSFKINPATASVKSITSATKKMAVKMTTKPSSKGASTYQIYYKQKGTSTWKKTTTTAQSKTIKKLKKGKQYYVKARAYKKIGTKTYYGAWSKTKLSKKIK